MYKAAKEIAERDSTDKSFVLKNLQYSLDALNKKESVLLDTLLAEQITKELYQDKVNEIKRERIELKRQILAAEKNSDLLTLEPIKNVFLEANRAKSEFLAASDSKKRAIIEKLLWNLLIEDKSVAQIKFKSPYQVLAKAPKNATISEMLGYGDSNASRASTRRVR